MTIERGGSVMPRSPALRRSPDAAIGVLIPGGSDIDGHGAGGAEGPSRGPIAGEARADERLQPDDAGERQEGHRRPVFAGVRQQRVPRHQPQARRNFAAVKWVMMDNRNRRLMADVPAGGAGPAGEVGVLVVQEELAVEATEPLEALA